MQTELQKIKVAIVDDHGLFRKGLIQLLDQERYEVMFDVENGKRVIEKLNDDNVPDIMIMDIQMPGMDGYETVEWLKEKYPEIKILVVSMVDREEAIVRMIKLGVKGYLSKVIEPEDLHSALQTIMKKNYYYPEFVTNRLVHSIQNQEDNTSGFLVNNNLWNSLNLRQQEFVRYACTEMYYEEIADKMFVSPKTIDGYRDVVFTKFNVKNRVGLVLFAIRNGLVTL